MLRHAARARPKAPLIEPDTRVSRIRLADDFTPKHAE